MLAGSMYAAHEAGERSVERQYGEADQDQRIAQLEQSKAPPVQAAPAGGTDLVAKLTELKGLLDAGALTQGEFDVAKHKLLGA
jgi:hypothetical protein